MPYNIPEPQTFQEVLSSYTFTARAIRQSYEAITELMDNEDDVPVEFQLYSRQELIVLLQNSLKDLERNVSLQLVASSESKLMKYFYEYNNRRTDIGKALNAKKREIKRRGNKRISLSEDVVKCIFKAFETDNENHRKINEYNLILDYRHWLAHGRYGDFNDTLKSKYDVNYILLTCQVLFDELDGFEEEWKN